MSTITIQVSDSKAMKLIQDLADLNIIQIVKEVTSVQKEAKTSLPLWQKQLLDERIKNLSEDKKTAIDFDEAIREVSTELGL
jgi:hypothetical protein